MTNIQLSGKLKLPKTASIESELDVLYWQTPHEGSSWCIEQLIINSRQDHIVATTPGDADERFESHDTYRNWSKSGKLLVALVDETKQDLAGIVWFSTKLNELVPSHPTTFAIRLYEGYVGRGLGRPFMIAAHVILDQTVEYPYSNVWLDTDVGNIPAIKLYESFGYKRIMETELGRVVMTYTSRDEE